MAAVNKCQQNPKAMAPGLLQGPLFVSKNGGPYGDRTHDTRIKSPVTGVLYSISRYDVVFVLGLDSYLEYCIILLDNKEFISNFISKDAPSVGYWSTKPTRLFRSMSEELEGFTP